MPGPKALRRKAAAGAAAKKQKLVSNTVTRCPDFKSDYGGITGNITHPKFLKTLNMQKCPLTNSSIWEDIGSAPIEVERH